MFPHSLYDEPAGEQIFIWRWLAVINDGILIRMHVDQSSLFRHATNIDESTISTKGRSSETCAELGDSSGFRDLDGKH